MRFGENKSETGAAASSLSRRGCLGLMSSHSSVIIVGGEIMSQKEIWRIRKAIQRHVKLENDTRCAICGKRKGGRNFHRHHIIPISELGSVEKAKDVSNILVLCERCHVAAHQAAGTTTWAMRHDLV